MKAIEGGVKGRVVCPQFDTRRTTQMTKTTHHKCRHPVCDEFSNYFFLASLILGVWCLFEGGIYLILDFLLTEITIVCKWKN